MKTFFTHFSFTIPLVAVVTTEILKLVITFVKTGKIRWKDFFSTGGIPSGHSTFVSSLIIVALVKEGLSSFEFSISFVFGFLVIFDSVKLRGEAGKHAKELNKLIGKNKFTERLGHSPFEVFTGICLGSGLAFLMLSV